MENIISKQLGIIKILESKKIQIESNSQISLSECYDELKSLLFRAGYTGNLGISYLNRAYNASNKGRNALCTFIDELVFEITQIGLPTPLKKTGSDINISNTNRQSQQQAQSIDIVLEVFIESIKEELTGKQMKELIEIIKEEPDKEISRNKIIDKLKDFGIGVLSSIVGNIITNPSIISRL